MGRHFWVIRILSNRNGICHLCDWQCLSRILLSHENWTIWTSAARQMYLFLFCYCSKCPTFMAKKACNSRHELSQTQVWIVLATRKEATRKMKGMEESFVVTHITLTLSSVSWCLSLKIALVFFFLMYFKLM